MPKTKKKAKKKWGNIGAPKSPKRKAWLKKLRGKAKKAAKSGIKQARKLTTLTPEGREAFGKTAKGML